MTSETQWATAAIRIMATELTIEGVSKRLGASPRYRFPKAEHKFIERGIWYLWSGLPSGRPLREHIKALTDFIQPRVDSLKQITLVCPAELSCAFASSTGETSFAIEPSVLELLAKVRFQLFLSLYPPSNDDIFSDYE
jgi:hypothetical protein